MSYSSTSSAAEVERIALIRGAMLAYPALVTKRHAQVINNAIEDGVSTAEIVVRAIDALERHDDAVAARWNACQASRSAGGSPSVRADVQTTPATLPVVAPAAAPADEASQQWDASPDLRTEFGGNKAAYVAYCNATARGLARIYGR